MERALINKTDSYQFEKIIHSLVSITSGLEGGEGSHVHACMHGFFILVVKHEQESVP